MEKVGYKNPPIHTRFPVNRKDHTQKGPYLTPLLRKLLEKKIEFEDPETQKIIKGRVKDAVLWRLILNATQGENEAIKEILNRIDGKLADLQIDQSKHLHLTYEYRNKPSEDKVSSIWDKERASQSS